MGKKSRKKGADKAAIEKVLQCAAAPDRKAWALDRQNIVSVGVLLLSLPWVLVFLLQYFGALGDIGEEVPIINFSFLRTMRLWRLVMVGKRLKEL